MSLNAICKELRLQRNTVRRYARAASAEEMLTQTRSAAASSIPTSAIWRCAGTELHHAVELAAEIRQRGYGQRTLGTRSVSSWRTSPAPPSPTPVRPPTSRQVTMLMMRPRHKLTADEREQLREVSALRDPARGQ